MVNILWVRAGLWSRLVIYLLLLAAAVFTVVPFLWAIVNSVKTLTETFQLGAVIPFLNFEPTLDSWREVLADPQTSSAFVSSCVISAGTTIFALLLGVPAAYSLARYEFPMPVNDIALWFLSQSLLPPWVLQMCGRIQSGSLYIFIHSAFDRCNASGSFKWWGYGICVSLIGR